MNISFLVKEINESRSIDIFGIHDNGHCRVCCRIDDDNGIRRLQRKLFMRQLNQTKVCLEKNDPTNGFGVHSVRYIIHDVFRCDVFHRVKVNRGNKQCTIVLYPIGGRVFLEVKE